MRKYHGGQGQPCGGEYPEVCHVDKAVGIKVRRIGNIRAGVFIGAHINIAIIDTVIAVNICFVNPDIRIDTGIDTIRIRRKMIIIKT